MKGFSSSRIFRVLFFLFLTLHLLLIAGQRLYPVVDLPFHLAEATIGRYYHDPGNRFSEYYSLNRSLEPNGLYLFFCRLPFFPTVESANRVFLCLYVFLLPVSTLLVIRRLGGNPWYALFSFLLLYNYNVTWGFVGFFFSLPFVLFLFYLLADGSGRPSPGKNLLVALLLLLLFFTHLLAALFAAGLFLLVSSYRYWKSPGRLVRETLALLPFLLLLVIWGKSRLAPAGGQSLPGFFLDYYRNDYLGRFPERIGLFFCDNFYLRSGPAGIVLAVFFSLFILAMALPALKAAARNERSRPALIFVLWSLACCLLLPSVAPGVPFLFQRYPVFLFLSLIVLGSVYPPGRRMVKAGAAVVVCLLHFVLWADYFRGFDRENSGFTREFFPAASENKKLAALIYEQSFRGAPLYIHFSNYYIVWNRGIAATCVVDYPFSPVGRRAGFRALPPQLGLEFLGSFSRYDGRFGEMDCLLLRGKAREGDEKYLANFRPMKSTGKWRLLRNSSAGREEGTE